MFPSSGASHHRTGVLRKLVVPPRDCRGSIGDLLIIDKQLPPAGEIVAGRRAKHGAEEEHTQRAAPPQAHSAVRWQGRGLRLQQLVPSYKKFLKAAAIDAAGRLRARDRTTKI